MVEILSLIKGLQLQMNRMNETFHEAIYSTTYYELQTFVQLHIRDMIKKVTQKKRDLTKRFFLSKRNFLKENFFQHFNRCSRHVCRYVQRSRRW